MNQRANGSKLDEVIRQIPFHLDDFPEVNALFLRWVEHRHSRDRRTLDLWVYCYTHRYFMIKFIREPAYEIIDFDVLLEKALQSISRNLSSVREPDRFANWVCVVCRNTYLNYIRMRRRSVSLEHNPTLLYEYAHEEETVVDQVVHDQTLVQQTLLTAIMKLPESLKEIATLRLLENRSYEEIAERTHRPVATIRTYMSRVLLRLRDDPGLAALLIELDR